MKRDYEFEKSNVLPFIYDSKMEQIVKLNNSSLFAASQFILGLLESKSFYLQLLEYENKKTFTRLTFLAKSHGKSLKFSLENEYLNIDWQNESFVYQLDFFANRIYANLISYETRLKDKTIKQSVQMHVLIVEIKIQDKKYLLNLPFDISYFMDTNYFYLINQNTDIQSLKKIYKDYFYLNQTVYEKSIASSVSIFKIEKDKEILIDELFLVQGQIEKYFLSTELGNIKISITGTKENDGVIIISNYHGEKSIGIESAIAGLYQKAEYLLAENRDEYYKQIRNRIIK